MLSRVSDANLEAFYAQVGDLAATPEVQKMKQFHHHGKMLCYNHSMFVSYISYRLARRFRWDARAAARGGLLHDLYLYNNRDKSAHPGWQCFDHPVAAWRNARELTELSQKEENIILSHMWPLARFRPRSREAALVDFVDTLCATLELCRIYRPIRLRANLPTPLAPVA